MNLMERARLADRIDFIRLGGLVTRYHTKHTVKENTVAHHSSGVAWMVYFLTGGSCSVNLVMSALAHDLAEQVTGDISSPTKRRFPELAKMVSLLESEILESKEVNFESQLNDDEKRILKLADCMDGILFCIGELELGNTSILPVCQRYCEYIEALKPTDHEWVVYSAIRFLLRRYQGD